MSRFLDGPLAGRTLANARAPVFLRVTVDGAGKVDCLDQLEDTPRADEVVHVYELVPGTDHGVALVKPMRGPCVRMASGDYRHRPDVDGQQLRDNDVWRSWCLAEPLPGQIGAGL